MPRWNPLESNPQKQTISVELGHQQPLGARKNPAICLVIFRTEFSLKAVPVRAPYPTERGPFPHGVFKAMVSFNQAN